MKTLVTFCAVAPTLFLLAAATALYHPSAAQQQDPAKPEAAQQPGVWTPARVREAIEARYRQWGDARIAYDREALQSMAAPDLYIQLIGTRITGEEFLNTVSEKNPRGGISRFDVEILTVQPRPQPQETKDAPIGNAEWQLVICEKIEWTMTGAEEQGPVLSSVWVTRDGWRYTEDGRWLVTYSEEIGHENWPAAAGIKPPLADW